MTFGVGEQGKKTFVYAVDVAVDVAVVTDDVQLMVANRWNQGISRNGMKINIAPGKSW